jgi:hypothetical protein
MNYIECQQFEQRDQAYLGMLTDAQTSDPLGLQTDGIQAAVIELNVQRSPEPPTQALTIASERGIRRSLPDIYHRVGPEFVAMVVTRYMGGVEINGGKYEGPNPSNSAYMAVDRFVFGSMQKLRDKDPVAEAQLLKRMSYLPEHLRALIQAADRQGDDDPLWVLASDNEELRSMAVEVGTNIRKFKVGHKSFADKGLVAKGKQLTTAQPDLLSDLIEYAKTNEGKI